MNLEHFKSKLSIQKEKLEKEIGQYQKEDPYKKNLRESEVMDDAITEIEEHDRLIATSEELKKDLRAVERALERVETQKYGVCVSCGNKIEEKRLEVVPTATRCLSCQKKSKER